MIFSFSRYCLRLLNLNTLFETGFKYVHQTVEQNLKYLRKIYFCLWLYNVHSRTFHANFIGFVLTLAYSRISALPFCLRYLFNANSFFASSSLVSFNKKMGLSIKGSNFLFCTQIKRWHFSMSDQNITLIDNVWSNAKK